jgi:WD40 repeat protein
VWDADKGQEVLTLKGHTSAIYGVAYSPTGKYIASSSNDRTVRLWDADTGKEILTLKGHWDLVSRVAFSSDGKHLVSGGYDKTIKIWDIVLEK